MVRDRYLEKFIDSKFSELHGRLDKIDDSNKDRDETVKEMDEENKKRLDALEKDMSFIKRLVQGVGWFIGVLASGVGLWKAVH